MSNYLWRRNTAFSAAFLFALLTAALTAASASAANPSFAPAVNYPTGSLQGPGPAPVSTVAGDFNGDGMSDVAAADFGFAPKVLFNQGAGVFGAASNISGTTGVQSLAAGDVNSDGRDDLVAMSPTRVYILRGNANGTFTLLNRYTMFLGAQVQAILLDYNGDGRLDIAAQTFFGIQTRRGNGNGSFSAGPFSIVPGASTLSAITDANINGDADRDLFALDGLSSTTFALRGDGTGRFRVAGRLSLSGLIPEDVAAADLNGDGIDDVGVIGSFSFTVGFALSNGLGGFFSFAPATQFGGPGPTSLAFGDFNDDGNPDAVVSNVANVLDPSVLMFTGNGTANPTNTGSLSVTDFPQNPAIADFNGDGQDDVAVVGRSALSVLLNTTS